MLTLVPKYRQSENIGSESLFDKLILYDCDPVRESCESYRMSRDCACSWDEDPKNTVFVELHVP